MAENRQKVLLAGDSISFGYGQRVKEILRGIFEVENLPENGGTSANLLAHVEEWMVKPSFQVIHLNCGLHDLAVERDACRHRVPLRLYKANVEEIIRRLRKETSASLVWATTTPVVDEWHRVHKSFDRFERDVQLYNEAAAGIVARLKVPVDDLHKAIEDAGRRECISGDGVHMDDSGYNLLARTVADFLLTMREIRSEMKIKSSD